MEQTDFLKEYDRQQDDKKRKKILLIAKCIVTVFNFGVWTALIINENLSWSWLFVATIIWSCFMIGLNDMME